MGGKSTTEKKAQGLIKYFQLHEIEFLKKKFTESAVSINGFLSFSFLKKNFKILEMLCLLKKISLIFFLKTKLWEEIFLIFSLM